MTKEKLQALLTLLLELEAHERPNYLATKTKWEKWLKVRKDIIGNPQDHPLYPYLTRDYQYYEKLGEHIYEVIQHLKFDTSALEEDNEDNSISN